MRSVPYSIKYLKYNKIVQIKGEWKGDDLIFTVVKVRVKLQRTKKGKR